MNYWMPDNGSADPAEVRRTFLFAGLAFVIAGAFSLSKSGGGIVILLWGVVFILVGSCAPAYLRLSDRAQLAVAAIILIALIAVGVVLGVLYFQGVQNAYEARFSADAVAQAVPAGGKESNNRTPPASRRLGAGPPESP